METESSSSKISLDISSFKAVLNEDISSFKALPDEKISSFKAFPDEDISTLKALLPDEEEFGPNSHMFEFERNFDQWAVESWVRQNSFLHFFINYASSSTLYPSQLDSDSVIVSD